MKRIRGLRSSQFDSMKTKGCRMEDHVEDPKLEGRMM
jgi:hypothetical protein